MLALNIYDEDIFDTPKPEQLLYRIIQIATNKDDLILDCFLGSGTTAAVAHKLGRDYIGIDIDERTFKYACERLKKYVKVKTEAYPMKYNGVVETIIKYVNGIDND